MKPLGLTALVHEGPMARAYLGVLASQGWRLERVVWMVQRRDSADGRMVAPWLPSVFRQRWALTVQDLRMLHWPREFMRRHRAWCEPWLHALSERYGVSFGALMAIVGRAPYGDCASRVDEVLVDGLADPALERHLARLPDRTTLLFTGGGMVPASLLQLPNCRFIHVHPGVLPAVRGADGLLWSVLLRGSPGASAFYMSPGLDTGDLILGEDLPLPPLPACWSNLDPDMAYRLLYSFLDPLLRAVLLSRVVRHAVDRHGGCFGSLPAAPQRPEDGVTFHFMHRQLRMAAFRRLGELQPVARGR